MDRCAGGSARCGRRRAGGGSLSARAPRARRCVATGETLPEAALVRFAAGPDGVLVPDVAAKLPGRGVWVRAGRDYIEKARRSGGFARGLKAKVVAREDLADLTETLLARRCLDFLGLARRAGAVAMGATDVDSTIRARPVPILIEASDGSADGREKLLRLHAGVWGATPPTVGCFTGAEIGMALGRERVIHACLLQERMAQGWAADIGRLAGFRAIVPSSWPASWPEMGWGDASSEPQERSALRPGAAPGGTTIEDDFDDDDTG